MIFLFLGEFFFRYSFFSLVFFSFKKSISFFLEKHLVFLLVLFFFFSLWLFSLFLPFFPKGKKWFKSFFFWLEYSLLFFS
ncbi:MAG: hypothetical protein FJY91_02180 [Candidatus Harrisonbacteria bacterium]|nr:hypothetical protein [Candidatus Harrisonbacteria bacterium]